MIHTSKWIHCWVQYSVSQKYIFGAHKFHQTVLNLKSGHYFGGLLVKACCHYIINICIRLNDNLCQKCTPNLRWRCQSLKLTQKFVQFRFLHFYWSHRVNSGAWQNTVMPNAYALPRIVLCSAWTTTWQGGVKEITPPCTWQVRGFSIFRLICMGYIRLLFFKRWPNNVQLNF